MSLWAVVNAAGFVRVDDAERETDACWRDNVTAPVTLAAACRRRGLPLAMFSSDLVSDGAASRLYVEDDLPNPLSVYGRSKTEAERRVLKLMPQALVIRTSAFFGPWDEANFATAVWRTLAAGQPFEAADDAVVSPTYVPDLVNATLDLLIDGEGGVWHLANVGAVTWCDFARALAAAGGLRADLVRAVSYRQVWSPAIRPAFSALGSTHGRLLPPLGDAIANYAGHMLAAAAFDREATS